jgi:general secretion pathway protein F
MPVFEYIALDKKGRKKQGIVNADDSKEAIEKLRGQQLYPSRIAPIASERSRRRGGGTRQRLFGQRVNRGDLVVVLRQLATLMSAGIPLAEALDSVVKQTDKRSLHRLLAQVQERINEGSSLAGAVGEQPQAFPATFAAMIRAGENSGTLELVLERLADFGEQQLALTRRLQSSLAYPILIFLVSLGVIFFLMSYVVPRVSGIFLDFEQALPLPTLLLMKVSGFVQAYWWGFPLLIALLWLAVKHFLSTERGKAFWDRHLLRLPLIGRIVHNIIIARVSHTLGTLLQNGVSLMHSMAIARNVVSNSQMQRALDETIRDVSEGSSLASPLSKQSVFPASMVQLVASGEQSGQLDQMFLKVAQTSENFVSNKISLLTSLLEPIMILVMGAIVGFVVLAVLLPIFDMSTLVR